MKNPISSIKFYFKASTAYYPRLRNNWFVGGFTLNLKKQKVVNTRLDGLGENSLSLNKNKQIVNLIYT